MFYDQDEYEFIGTVISLISVNFQFFRVYWELNLKILIYLWFKYSKWYDNTKTNNLFPFNWNKIILTKIIILQLYYKF